MSSSTIPKKLFEKAEFVSSHDPDVDHSNIVYIESDSEESERFNYEMHQQETAHQEVVHLGTGDPPDKISDIPDHPIHVKVEEELIIEDVAMDEDSNDSWTTTPDYFGSPSPKIKTEGATEDIEPIVEGEKVESPVGMLTPSIVAEESNMDEEVDEDEEQFVLIDTPQATTSSKKTEEENAAMDTSLVDHQYSQQETTHKEFCFDLVKDLLKESGNEGNPTALPLLTKFTELVECFVDEHEQKNSQMSLLLTNMKKTLVGWEVPEEAKPPEPEDANNDSLENGLELAPMSQEDPKDVSLSTQEIINIPETQSDEELTTDSQERIEQKPVASNIPKQEPVSLEDEAEVQPKNLVKIENEVQEEKENIVKLKIEITKVRDFATMLSESANELMNLPMESEENCANVKNKLKALHKDSLKKIQSLSNETAGDEAIENERSKKMLVAKLADKSSDEMSSDSDSDDSDGGQNLNLNRKIPTNGPQTPAVVSSTKEDSDGSETAANAERSRSSDSETNKNTPDKHTRRIEKLLDFSTLVHQPGSSKNAPKQQKPKKKKAKQNSDIDSIPSSSDDDDSETTEQSDLGSDEDTSDVEKMEAKMKLRLNAERKQELMAPSDSDEDDDNTVSDLSEMSSDDEASKPKSKKKTKNEDAKTSHEADTEPEMNGEADEEPAREAELLQPAPAIKDESPQPAQALPVIGQQSQLDDTKVVNGDASSVTIDSGDDDPAEQRPPKKKIKRDSTEREIFSKGFLEINGSVKKEKASSSPPKKLIRIESNGEKSADYEKTSTDGAIDVSMYDSRPSARKVDLFKYIERRAAHEAAGTSSTSSVSPSNTAKPVSIVNEDDDDIISLSSDSDSEISAAPAGSSPRIPKRKKLLTDEQLQEETKQALKEENKRVDRLKKKHETLTQLLSQRFSQHLEDPLSQEEPELILDCDQKKRKVVTVHPELVKKLKEHQKEGIKFMYDTCYGSIGDDVKTESGCILAHCMGLGKTLQLITLLHTLICNPELETRRVIVICPKSTIMNWNEEFKKWLRGIDSKELKIWYLEDHLKFSERVDKLESWFKYKSPGVFLINYEAFRNMVHYKGPKRLRIPLTSAQEQEIEKMRVTIDKCLLNPGPDLVVCDEGHIIKNQTGATNRAITNIRTKRRIVLTGTPVQNNLNEYYAMVDWIKPALLGTVKEFNNLYANPIKDGQHFDSNAQMIKKMKQRSFILNRKLEKFVQRKEASVLKEFLPDKHEYCIFVPLTNVQENLYERFLKKNPLNGGHKLLQDYTALRKIWTHPKVCQNAYDRAMKGELNIGDTKKKNQIEEGDNEDEDLLDTVEGSTGVKSNWWKELASEHDLESLLSSNKLILLFEIIRKCAEHGEKVLIFSAFVAVLNVVEEFMRKISNQNSSEENRRKAEKYGYSKFQASWMEGYDYFRLDGSTKREARHQMIQKFNDKSDKRLRCFLISARAGGQGINLIGANRCIILDTAWNPSADQQNIFRIYRLGQPKTCYVYRLIALGTMEEKVYSRSVTKQAMSGRVVDKQQIDRHYKMDELSQLYVLTKTDYSKRPAPRIPSDDVLTHLLHNFPRLAFKYHDHESLLENKPEQDLNEDEINEAWEQYKQESERSIARTQIPNGMIPNFPNELLRGDLASFNYLAAASNLPPNSLDQASGIFNHLYGPPSSFFPLQNLISYDLSAAIRNNLVPTSSIANTNVHSTNSVASSLLRTQLNNKAPDFVLPMFNFANNPTSLIPSTVKQSLPAARAHKRKGSDAKKPQTSNNLDSMISLQQRYNGSLPRPHDNISDVLTATKSSSAHLSIVPDPPVARTPPFPPSPRHSPSVSRNNPGSIANQKERSNMSGNALLPQNLSRKTPPTSAPPSTSYSKPKEVLRIPPVTTIASFPKPNSQPKPQIQKEQQRTAQQILAESRMRLASADSRMRLPSPNLSPRTSVAANSSPSQSARTTPVKSVDLTKAQADQKNRYSAPKNLVPSNHVNAGTSGTSKHKIAYPSNSIAGNPISQQVTSLKNPVTKPQIRLVNKGQGTSSSMTRPDDLSKIIRQNSILQNKIGSVQGNPQRIVMSSASQNSIPQKAAGKLMAPVKPPQIVKKVVRAPITNQPNQPARGQSSSQLPISITKLNLPGGLDVRPRPLPVISSAVSLQKLPPTTRVNLQPSSASGSSASVQKRPANDLLSAQSPKRPRVEPSHVRIARGEQERRKPVREPGVQDIVEIE